MSEAKTIDSALEMPTTVASLVKDLVVLGVRPGMVLLVHCSLSKLGWVCGDALAVIQALNQVLTPASDGSAGYKPSGNNMASDNIAGTLVMPTHTGQFCDPAKWINPPVPQSWWQVIRDNMPAFDPQVTPSRKMGAVAECFRSMPGVLRSNHPQVSFAARGPEAATITANHSLEFSLGENSPLARLYDLDAWVLLLGVGHENNTSFHLAEYRAEFSGKKIAKAGAAVFVEGHRRWVQFDDLEELDDADFVDIGAAFSKSTGLVRSGKVAKAEALLFRQRPAVDYAKQYIETHRSAS